MKNLFILLFFFLFCNLIISGCSKEEVNKTNQIFTLQSPEDGAVDLIPSIEFKWTKSQKAVKYSLRITDKTDENNIIDIMGLKTNSYLLESIKSAREYSWKVLAHDDNNMILSTPAWTFNTKSNAFLWNDQFYSPQLDRDRRIYVYLPPDYEKSDMRYPVMYMHDAQSLFYYNSGENGLMTDQVLDEFYHEKGFGLIIVAVRTIGSSRNDLLSPWVSQGTYFPSSTGNGGLGGLSLDFIKETLKPAVDKEFRTLGDRSNTGIGGMSMGGLHSLYGILQYPEVFGFSLVFSPSLWFVDDKMFNMASERANLLDDNRIYFWAGGEEIFDPVNVAEHVEQVVSIFETAGYSNFKYAFESRGDHSGKSWKKAFPSAIEWLFELE